MRYEHRGGRRGRPRLATLSWKRIGALGASATAACIVAGFAAAGGTGISTPSGDGSGSLQTLAKIASADRHHPFFDAAIGTNGQSCAT